MTIRFACPNCGVKGSADDASAGRSARCKYCEHRFTIPRPGEVVSDVYSLEETPEEAPVAVAGELNPFEDPAFARPRGDESAGVTPRRPRPPRSPSAAPRSRRREERSPWPARLAWAGGVLAIAIAAVALLVPKNGPIIAACALMAMGSILVLVGYAVGAYGAFSEDFLYGFLYVVIPLYTAYYMVTRWDDLWVWFACMTSGVGLVLLGFELARLGGVTA